MEGPPKTAEFQFGLAGLISKQDPALLKNGQYRSIYNVECVQEGSLSSRSGRKTIGDTGIHHASAAGYMVRKFNIATNAEDPTSPSTNPRYVGLLDGAGNFDLYRTLSYATASYAKVATGINTAANVFAKRFALAAYSAGATGNPWAFIATETQMLKDDGLGLFPTLHTWGILPAWGVATAVAVTTGNLDGGAAGSPPGSTGYDYVYTFVSTDSNNEGNPSATMLADSVVSNGTPVTGNLTNVAVTVYGTNDPKIGFINIYRRGGTLGDTWRLVGQVANPGWSTFPAGTPSTTTFTDNIGDLDLLLQPTVDRFNDPPVPSSVPVPLKGTVAAIASAGLQTVTVATGATAMAQVTPGSTVHFFYDRPSSGTATDPAPEDVVVLQVGAGGTTFQAYFQHTHTSGAQWEVDTLVAQPCNLVIPIQQFLVVAGDPNNPHVLYRSTGSMPESYPPVPADGSISTVNCGTPSNPVRAICEFRGSILTLNAYALYETILLEGSFIPAQKVADHGLAAPFAWCKTDTEVWFLSYDGVYSWDGGACRKRSEVIDPIFYNGSGATNSGESYNGIPVLDYNPSVLVGQTTPLLTGAIMEYRRGQIYLKYTGTGFGTVDFAELVCEPMFGDRWRIYDEVNAFHPSVTSTQFLYTEPDTGSMYEFYSQGPGGVPTLSVALRDQVTVSGSGVNNTSDYFTGTDASANGINIAFDIRLPWIDFGGPTAKKILEEAMLELDASGMAATDSQGIATKLSVDILTDYNDDFTIYGADPAATDTLIIDLSTATVHAGRTFVSLLPNMQSGFVVSGLQAFSREFSALSFHIYGKAYATRATFYRLFFKYQDTPMLTTGACWDWDNLGHPHDKRLYQMTVEYDTSGVGQTIVLDTLTGPGGAFFNQGSVPFTLNNPVILGSGRALQTFPLLDPTIVKEIRVRQVSNVSSAGHAGYVFFKIFSVTFPEMEKYPPDISPYGPWTDNGYEYDQYCNQLDLEVNTNNQPITVGLQQDGNTVFDIINPFTFVIQSTEADRRRNITLPPLTPGRKWRWFLSASQATLFPQSTGMFQVFSFRFSFRPADKGDVIHTEDWKDFGHPWDKYMRTLTISWDNSLSGAPITVQMDTINGINGQTLNLNVAQFVLPFTSGRSQQVFPLPVDTIAKLVRIRPILPAPIPIGFKMWSYVCPDKIDYPADIITSTPWRDAENPDDKNPSWLYIDMDTAGITCTVNLMNENGVVMTVLHTGTLTDRKFNYPIPADVFAKMWRLILTIGSGGKAQLFDWGFARWQPTPELSPADPPDTVVWTPWNDFQWPYDKIARNLIWRGDTGGVAASVQMQADGVNMGPPFIITTTYVNREVVLATPPNLIGKLWRLLITPGAGGKAKLWNWSLDVVKEPPSVTYLNSYQQDFGYAAWKFIKGAWVEYACAGPVNLVITSDTGVFTFQLPAQPVRGLFKVPPGIPAVWGAGLNKSKLYDVQLTSVNPTQPFKLYANSWIEYYPIGLDQHRAYSRMNISSLMQLPAA